MRIVNLLEGSDRLYHITKIGVLKDIIRSGFLLGVPMGGMEADKVREKLNITGKMFYISFARSMQSSFIRRMVSWHSVCFEVDGRMLGRYGKVKPFNFFHVGGNDEMEDRLIGDRVRIPLDSRVITGVRMYCSDSSLEHYQLALALVELGIPVKLFATGADMLTGRNYETDLNVFFAGAEDDTDDGDFSNLTRIDFTGFVDVISRYMDGETLSPDDVQTFDRVFRIFEHRFEGMMHKFMTSHYDAVRGLLIKMRRVGVVPSKWNSFIEAINDGIYGGKKFSEIWEVK